MRALAALLVGGLSARLGSPLSQPDTSHLRLGFIDLQSGSRGAPQRIVFAAPPFQGVQSELFQLLWGRALLGVCVDCTARSRAGLTTRPLRRNSTVSVQTEQRTPDGWDSLLQAAAEREEQSAEAQAHTILIYLRGKNISGVGIVHNDDLHDVKDPFIRGAVVIGGHRFITDMYEAAQKRRASGKQCMVHIVESGELTLPADPEDPTTPRQSLPGWRVLPMLEADANNERLMLPLGRPMGSLHRVQQPSSSEPREVYHFQVLTDDLPRGQKLLLGALSHDNGQPTLLLSYTTGNSVFEEAHWALPVECGSEICSYQRLIVDSALDSSLLMSLRNVALGRTSDRFRFTVHSQALCVVRLRFADLKTVRLSQKQTAPAGGETWGQAASEHLLPVMYLYSVRVPALHQLTVRVEANQPVVLAASEDRLGALVSSSPSTLVEGFPENPAELMLASSQMDHTVYIGVTLLAPPDGFEIIAWIEEAPVLPPQPHQHISDLASELEAAGMLEGLTTSERAAIIQQVHADEVALGWSNLPTMSLRELRELRESRGLVHMAEEVDDEGGGLLSRLFASTLLLVGGLLAFLFVLLLLALHMLQRAEQEASQSVSGRASTSQGSHASRSRKHQRNGSVTSSITSNLSGNTIDAKAGNIDDTSADRKFAAHLSTTEASRKVREGAQSDGVKRGSGDLRNRRKPADAGGARPESESRGGLHESSSTQAEHQQSQSSAPAKPKALKSKPEETSSNSNSKGKAKPVATQPSSRCISSADGNEPRASLSNACRDGHDTSLCSSEGPLQTACDLSLSHGPITALHTPQRSTNARPIAEHLSLMNSPAGAPFDCANGESRKPRRKKPGKGVVDAAEQTELIADEVQPDDAEPLPAGLPPPAIAPVSVAVKALAPRQPKEAQPEEPSRVWVGPLNAGALEKEKELRASFSAWGTVTSCKLKVDGARLAPGYGFIYFKEASSAKALLKHIDEGGAPPHFLGRPLNVREAFYREGSVGMPLTGLPLSATEASADICVASQSEKMPRNGAQPPPNSSAAACSASVGRGSGGSSGGYLQAVCSSGGFSSMNGAPASTPALPTAELHSSAELLSPPPQTAVDLLLSGLSSPPSSLPPTSGASSTTRLPGFLPTASSPAPSRRCSAAELPPHSSWMPNWLSPTSPCELSLPHSAASSVEPSPSSHNGVGVGSIGGSDHLAPSRSSAIPPDMNSPSGATALVGGRCRSFGAPPHTSVSVAPAPAIGGAAGGSGAGNSPSLFGAACAPFGGAFGGAFGGPLGSASLPPPVMPSAWACNPDEAPNLGLAASAPASAQQWGNSWARPGGQPSGANWGAFGSSPTTGQQWGGLLRGSANGLGPELVGARAVGEEPVLRNCSDSTGEETSTRS